MIQGGQFQRLQAQKRTGMTGNLLGHRKAQLNRGQRSRLDATTLIRRLETLSRMSIRRRGLAHYLLLQFHVQIIGAHLVTQAQPVELLIIYRLDRKLKR